MVRRYNKIFDEIGKHDEIVALRTAAEAAAAKLKEAEDADPAVAAARQAVKEAMAAQQDQVEAKLAAHPDGQTLLAEMESQREELADLEYQQALAQFKLFHVKSPIHRRLMKDEALQSLKGAAQQAPRGRNRDEWAAYYEARDARLAEMDDARPLLETAKSAEAAIAQAEENLKQLEGRLAKLRSSLASAKSEAVTTARQALETALASEPLTQLRNAGLAARNAHNTRFNEVLKSHPTVQEIRPQIDELARQIKEHKQKASTAPSP